MPVLARTALLVLLLVALAVAGQGGSHLQIAYLRSPGVWPWLALLKIAGGLGLALWCFLQLRRLGRQRDLVIDAPGRRPGLHLRAHTNPLLQSMFLLGLLAATVFLFLDERYRGFPAVAMLALTVYAGFLVMTSQDKDAPALSMDDTALEHMWFGRVPWDQIHGIELVREPMVINRVRSTIPFLVLGVAFPGRYFERAPLAARMGQEGVMTPGARFGELRIPLGPLDERPARVLALARSLRSAVTPATLAGWKAGMSGGDVARLVATQHHTVAGTSGPLDG